jgi:hypothetical protein
MFDNLKYRIVECADVSALWATSRLGGIASGKGSTGVSPAPAGVSPGGSPEVSGETPDTATETVALPAVQRARPPQPRSLAENGRTI